MYEVPTLETIGFAESFNLCFRNYFPLRFLVLYRRTKPRATEDPFSLPENKNQ